MLYGMTNEGGINSDGVLFSYNVASKTYTQLGAFSQPGGYPLGSLMHDPANGLLYGMVQSDGLGEGFIYAFNPATNTIPYTFNFNGTDGEYPLGNLTYDPVDSMLYGMTSVDGAIGFGTVFRYDPNTNAVNTLVNFNATDGNDAEGSLTFDPADSMLYGMTYQGGTHSVGVIFKVNPKTGTETLLKNFIGTNGDRPGGSLVYDTARKLMYGTAYYGGSASIGVIFSLDPITDSQKVLVNFTGPNGQYPNGTLMYNPVNGLYYGTASGGGANSDGLIFSFNPANDSEKVLVNFNYSNGSTPMGDLIFSHSDSLLYGLTKNGGAGYGTLFSYNVKTNTEKVLVDLGNAGAAYPNGSLLLVNDTTAPTGLSTITNKYNIFVYPNPSHGKFVITVPNVPDKARIEIYNMLGQSVYSGDLIRNNTEIDLNGQAAGLYLYRLTDEKGETAGSGKLVVE